MGREADRSARRLAQAQAMVLALLASGYDPISGARAAQKDLEHGERNLKDQPVNP